LPRSRLFLAFFLLALTIVLGTLLYSWIEGWNFLDSLYMTVLVLTTIGFKEVRPLSTSGTVFTIVFSLIGFIFLAGFISLFSSNLLEILISEKRKGKRMQNKISKLKDHIILCGSGKLGRHIIASLLDQHQEFVVVDDAEHLSNLLQTSPEQNSEKYPWLYVEGDPTQEEFLKRTGIMKAAGIITCMPQDAQNLFIGVTAKKLCPQIKWTTVVNDENNSTKFTTVGADDVVRGDYVIGNRLANSMVNQNLYSFLEQTTPLEGSTGLIVGAVNLEESSPLNGSHLKDSKINEELGLLIFAIKKSGESSYTLNPGPNTVLEAEDTVISLGTPEQVQSLEKFINPPAKGWFG
jgi:voltage-gated potassium channel